MSNIGKHLFEAREVWTYYRGKIARETEHTWFFENDRRALKGPRDVLVDGSIDPSAAEAAYRAAIRANAGPVEDAQKALSEAKRAQRMAAIAALTGKAS